MNGGLEKTVVIVALVIIAASLYTLAVVAALDYAEAHTMLPAPARPAETPRASEAAQDAE